MANIKFLYVKEVPLEMHKARVIQKIQLKPIEERVKRNKIAGNNSYLYRNEDTFIDMLTDSGVNAMSDQQLAAMMQADDAYAGSESFYKFEEAMQRVFNMKYVLVAHQGRACEHLLAWTLIKEGQLVPMNYHFTTMKALINKAKGKVVELIIDEGIKPQSVCPFKGNIDIDKLKKLIKKEGADNIAFVRIEAGTNLIGGQPVSLENMEAVSKICKKHKIKIVLDASLLSDNLYFMMIREKQCMQLSVQELMHKVSKCFDIIYYSARKLTSARGGALSFQNEEDYIKVRDLVPLYEGFSTYGGASVKEIEAMTVGLNETLDFDMISQGPIFIEEMTKMCLDEGIPVVTPAGGLGIHLDCSKFVPHVPKEEYPAAAVQAALYLASGIRGTERGSLSEDRDEDGNEVYAEMELLRLALPRRVFTLSHIHFAVDRIKWLYENRDLIGGLKFTDEPKTLRFFFGKLEPIGDWQDKLVKKFKKDYSDSL